MEYAFDETTIYKDLSYFRGNYFGAYGLGQDPGSFPNELPGRSNFGQPTARWYIERNAAWICGWHRILHCCVNLFQPVKMAAVSRVGSLGNAVPAGSYCLYGFFCRLSLSGIFCNSRSHHEPIHRFSGRGACGRRLGVTLDNVVQFKTVEAIYHSTENGLGDVLWCVIADHRRAKSILETPRQLRHFQL